VSQYRLLPSAVLTTVVACSGVVVCAAQPTHEQLRIVAPAAPGGGWDQTARVMQQALQQAGIARTVPVENVPGAAGTIGLARFIGAERGRGDTLMVSGLIMLGGIVTHRSPVTLHDVTPIARLTGEYEVVVVLPSSRFASLRDLLDALRANPTSVSWGGGSAGGSDHILAGLITDAAGVSAARVNYIAFSGGGESLAAIVGGQVDVGINGYAELSAQIQAGTVQALGISSAERLPGLDVPTLREQGLDLVFENWRSVVAPPGISPADRDRLTRAIDAMVHSQSWREAISRYRWIDRYLPGEAFASFTDAEERRIRAILGKLGTNQDTVTLATAGLYPMFVLAGLAVTGIAALIAGLRRRQPSTSVARRWRSAALVGAAVVLNLVLAERVGFIVGSAVLFWLTARAFEERYPLRDALIGCTTAVAAYVLFARLLDLSLPAGVLERWF